ncbi:MAG: hypothetical protein DWQ36_24635 [Acidobacteria bacterium]|nr:MAG: hypothetical protein DWQ30_16945 [Acidobacteriota bacterium]REJ99646.1 MAG: hypothetical protein DWQ36_24635 [Acidobacteriota bacterium]
MLRRFLETLARVCFRAPRRAIVLATLPMALLGLWALRVPVDLSFTGMLDQESGEIARYFEISHEHQLGGYLLTLIELRRPLAAGAAESAEQSARLDAAVAKVAEVLSASPLVQSVQPPADPQWWVDNLPWLIDAELFDAATGLLEGGLDPAAGARLARAVGDAPLLDDPPGVRLVQVRMTNDPLEMAVGRWDFFEVEQLVREQVEPLFPEVAVRFAGMPAVAAQDQAYTLGLIRKLTPASLLLVLGLFSLVERRWQSLAAVLLVLVLAMGATLGVVGLLTGGLTLMETFFGVTVFGLGVDFAVHLFVRFREEREKWRGAEEAVAATLRGTGRGVVAGAVTTAGAFLIVSLAPDPVAVHLGLSGGIGLLLCLLLMLILLPAVWGLSERDQPLDDAAEDASRPDEAARRRRSASSALRTLRRFEVVSELAVRHPRSTLVATLALLVAAAFALLGFEFETDVSKVLNRKVDSVQTVERIQDLYELNGAPWIVTAEDLAEARRLARAFRASEEFSYATTLADLLPESDEEIARRRERLEELWPRIAALRSLLAGLPPEAIAAAPLLQPLLARLPEGWSAADLSRQMTQLLAALEQAPGREAPSLATLPAGVRERFESESGEQLVIAYARGSSLDALVARRQRAAAQEIDPEATSLSVLLETLMLGDRPWIRPVAFAIVGFVALVLFVDFRRPRLALLALVPVLVGTGLTIGVLCAAGVRFNIMTLTVLPLLCGLGVDDGIHVVHRMLEEGFVRPAHSAAAVGRAVLMTTLTTCSSFAVLLWTDHPGLETMSLVMLVGLPICWLSSITTLPALAVLLFPETGRRHQAESAGGPAAA